MSGEVRRACKAEQRLEIRLGGGRIPVAFRKLIKTQQVWNAETVGGGRRKVWPEVRQSGMLARGVWLSFGPRLCSR